MSRSFWLGILVICAIALGACSRGTPAPAEAEASQDSAVPVKVGRVEQRPEPVEIQAIGNIQPYTTVSVKSEVGGELTGVHFTEGQEVHKGQLLFTIDPRPFEAALKLAEANRAKNLAQAARARADAERYRGLAAEGVISQQQYDQARADAEALQASVEADEAAIETARLQLSYTKIYAPISGRTGNLLVHEGNLVKENDVALVVINQIQPIYAVFAVPAQYLPEIRRYHSRRPLRVEASPKDSNQPGAVGVLTFIDNNVDTATGTIQLKATFQNRDRALWPGQFVDVTVTLTTQPDAIVIPAQAIQSGQQGQFVFVVKPDMTVESRPVVVDRTRGAYAIVSQGLQPGETVVTDGQLRLVPGSRVTVSGGEPAQ
ncbi:MAG TPA: efflux RND transporter periplasmic adaptor subunit [Bryobacteraceae bacterium]|nr:efflux RND transporter periplasmic adaptor subunit [Bryobacteraceae bacterium]HPQ14774.1 efflux RND transporter periplasmic adaptor subunit [Bryobacteraceae bacterium]